MVYQPDYAKCQILVAFKNPCDKNFARRFGIDLGYELSEEEYKYEDEIFIYKTQRNKEIESIEKFTSLENFVSWAELRDLKIEKRWEHLKKIQEKISLLDDDITISDKDYETKLKEISDSILNQE